MQPEPDPAPRKMALGYLLASASAGGLWDALARLHSSPEGWERWGRALVEMQLLQLRVWDLSSSVAGSGRAFLTLRCHLSCPLLLGIASCA